MKDLHSARKKIPFAFALEALEALSPTVRPMFGGHIVSIGEKLILFLYAQEKWTQFRGVSVATMPEHYSSLAREFSSASEREKINKRPWLLLPSSAGDFEEQVLKACELILKGDPRIGREPEPKKIGPKGGKKGAGRKSKSG
jgi:hypothetical protein